MHSNQNTLRDAQLETFAPEAGGFMADFKDTLLILEHLVDGARVVTPQIRYLLHVIVTLYRRHRESPVLIC
jgi:hypothetical protein